MKKATDLQLKRGLKIYVGAKTSLLCAASTRPRRTVMGKNRGRHWKIVVIIKRLVRQESRGTF